jgi:hypothetical protein
MWTKFWDMHSGGSQKEDQQFIFIEAPEEEAKVIFYNRFGHNPERVTCTCCGEDYYIGESETLEEASAFQRNCKYDEEKNNYVEEQATTYCIGKYVTLEDFMQSGTAIAIYKEDILPEERLGEVPQQGYVWVE